MLTWLTHVETPNHLAHDAEAEPWRLSRQDAGVGTPAGDVAFFCAGNVLSCAPHYVESLATALDGNLAQLPALTPLTHPCITLPFRGASPGERPGVISSSGEVDVSRLYPHPV